jgi:glycosyltransferase involved in cell wall biosynthesis/predicted ATP-grasp superfamily ATP-dependent carboligase
VTTILHLIETGGTGGAETVYANLIRTLDSPRWKHIAVVPYKDWLFDQLVSFGIEPVVMPERGSFDFPFFARMIALIRSERVDLVQGHLFGSSIRAALLSMACRVPAIGTIHGEMDVSPTERFRTLKLAAINRGLERLVFVSDPLLAAMSKSLNLRPGLPTVIPNGIDPSHFGRTGGEQFRAEFGISPDEFVVGTVGNPSHAKGLDILLEAAAILKAELPRCRFVIVGDVHAGRGPDLFELRKARGLVDDVVLTGFRPDVPQALAAFDVYALSSRQEGFSLALVEAMATGLPVVATRCGGPEQILEDGITGLLVQNESPVELASAIRRLHSNAAERQRLAEAGRRAVCKRFTLEAQAHAYEKLYGECLTPNGRKDRRTKRIPISYARGDSASPKREEPVVMSPTVIITDGEQRAALATVRSLGRQGYRVHVCSSHANPLAGASRYCASVSRVANPLRDPDGFVSDLLRVTRNLKADMLLPVSEASLLSVLPRRGQFDCIIPFASAESFASICDKREVLKRAQVVGLAVPAQTEISDPRDSNRIDGLRFPVVLKPARSVSGNRGEKTRVAVTVTYAMNPSEWDSALASFPSAAYPILLQQRVEGPGFGISLLLWDGEVYAAFAHRRIREKPPSGGVSVMRESIPLDQNLLARSVELLRAFNWQGVAMVEFKLDQKTGVPYLMEINGRLWGSLQLAIDTGVDFPKLLVELAMGKRPSPVISYKIGVRSRWEWGDIDHLVASVFHSRRTLAVVPGSQPHRRILALVDFFRDFGQGYQQEVFRRDDPRPFLRETMQWFRRG